MKRNKNVHKTISVIIITILDVFLFHNVNESLKIRRGFMKV